MPTSCPTHINLEAFQQSLYYDSLERRVFTQAQFLDISSSSVQSNDSTPTSCIRCISVLTPLPGFTEFLLLVIQLPNASSPTIPLILLRVLSDLLLPNS